MSVIREKRRPPEGHYPLLTNKEIQGRIGRMAAAMAQELPETDLPYYVISVGDEGMKFSSELITELTDAGIACALGHVTLRHHNIGGNVAANVITRGKGNFQQVQPGQPIIFAHGRVFTGFTSRMFRRSAAAMQTGPVTDAALVDQRRGFLSAQQPPHVSGLKRLSEAQGLSLIVPRGAEELTPVYAAVQIDDRQTCTMGYGIPPTPDHANRQDFVPHTYAADLYSCNMSDAMLQDADHQ